MQDEKNLRAMASGEKTREQITKEITEKYKKRRWFLISPLLSNRQNLQQITDNGVGVPSDAVITILKDWRIQVGDYRNASKLCSFIRPLPPAKMSGASLISFDTFSWIIFLTKTILPGAAWFPGHFSGGTCRMYGIGDLGRSFFSVS